jgi:hypothetical protein
MTQTAENPVARLRSNFHGEVVSASDAGYDDARRVWNAAIDRRPLAVAQCLDEADVQAAHGNGSEEWPTPLHPSRPTGST